MARNLVESSIKYLNHNGVCITNRTKLSISNLFTFLGTDYEIDVKILMPDKKTTQIIDFKIGNNKYLQIIESDKDLENFKEIKNSLPDIDLVGIGSSRYAGKITEFDSLFLFESKDCQIGSIFIEDPSLSFDYAHILPLVKKCSILHGHTSTVMVEIIGSMNNGLVMDFSEAKKLIKEAIGEFDHKFFINKRYLLREDDVYYFVQFKGPKGFFSLQLPKSTVYLLPDEATVENLSKEIIRILSPHMPDNIDALGVYIYEGVNKGAHLLAKLE